MISWVFVPIAAAIAILFVWLFQPKFIINRSVSRYAKLANEVVFLRRENKQLKKDAH